jgi:hypothetical protein
VVGAVISFLGVPAGLIGNELSIRYGLRTIATLVFVLSAFAGGLFGFTAMLPYIAVHGRLMMSFSTMVERTNGNNSHFEKNVGRMWTVGTPDQSKRRSAIQSDLDNQLGVFIGTRLAAAARSILGSSLTWHWRHEYAYQQPSAVPAHKGSARGDDREGEGRVRANKAGPHLSRAGRFVVSVNSGATTATRAACC